jgi:hypothetical protein
MLGDLPPPQQLQFLRNQPANRTLALVPAVTGFKIAENESPRPQDRAYFSFNYFDNLSAAVNRQRDVNLQNVRVYRETFGLEKTFLDGSASVGLRLPLNTLSADSNNPNLGGSDTAVGDLALIFKYAVLEDCETGDLLSAGLVVVTPTGPGHFANFDSVLPLHSTTLQPFVGYVLNLGQFYLHGFSSLDIPTDSRDVTMWYDDVGLGYFAYHHDCPDRFLTAVVPTVEMHLNTPLNHRGVLRSLDPAGTPDGINLTFGTNFEFYNRARLAVGVVTPVTGPRPFDFEVIAQLRLRF